MHASSCTWHIYLVKSGSSALCAPLEARGRAGNLWRCRWDNFPSFITHWQKFRMASSRAVNITNTHNTVTHWPLQKQSVDSVSLSGGQGQNATPLAARTMDSIYCLSQAVSYLGQFTGHWHNLYLWQLFSRRCWKSHFHAQVQLSTSGHWHHFYLWQLFSNRRWKSHFHVQVHSESSWLCILFKTYTNLDIC